MDLSTCTFPRSGTFRDCSGHIAAALVAMCVCAPYLGSILTYPVQMQQHDQAGRSPLGLTLAGRAREWDRRALALNPFRATKPEVLCTAVSCVMTSNIHACMNACMRADTDARACIGHERGIYFGSRAPRRAVTAQVNSFSSRLSDPGLRDTGPTRDSRK